MILCKMDEFVLHAKEKQKIKHETNKTNYWFLFGKVSSARSCEVCASNIDRAVRESDQMNKIMDRSQLKYSIQLQPRPDAARA